MEATKPSVDFLHLANYELCIYAVDLQPTMLTFETKDWGKEEAFYRSLPQKKDG